MLYVLLFVRICPLGLPYKYHSDLTKTKIALHTGTDYFLHDKQWKFNTHTLTVPSKLYNYLCPQTPRLS